MKKFISMILAAGIIACTFSFVSCADDNKGAASASPQSLLLGDFESMQELFDHFIFENRFGRISLTDESAFVTSGESAAKLEVYGDYNAAATIPVMNVNLASYSESGGLDLRRLENITFDLYSTAEEELLIEIALNIDGEMTDYTQYTIAPGLNNISANYNVSVLSVGFNMEKGNNLLIRFPKPIPENGGLDPQLHYTFYMDNLAANFLAEAPDPLQIVLDENEVCSFDKTYQAYVVGVGGIGPCEGCLPQVSINEDLYYCKNQEGLSLKAVLPTGVEPLNDGWPFIYLLNAVWEAAGLRQHAEEGYDLVFDVYADTLQHFGVEVHHETYSRIYLGTGFDTKPRDWVQVRIPLSGLLVYNDKGELTMDYTDGMEYLAFTYSKFAGADKVVYFDNLRFEKAA